jgi:peroxiredoxin
MAVEVGDEAPDFELKDQDNQPVRLSSYRGKKNVLLVFYPLAFSPTCSTEMTSLRDDPPATDDEVETLTVSVDSVFAHRAWADQQGFAFRLLSDFHPAGEVARRYGVWNEDRGVSGRGTFVIDKAGVVRWKVVSAIPDARDQSEYRRALAEL